MSEQKKLLSELTTITENDVKDALISGLRSRPNSTSIYGGKGLTAGELKKQYDKYPEILRARFNDLVEAIKASLDNADKNGSQIAKEIMVVVQGFTTSARTDNLAHAIEEMIERILGAKAVADKAKAGAESAEAVAKNAVIIANSAESKADSAGNLAYGANVNASEAKGTANEAKNIADNAKKTSEEAKGLAESANSFANDAYKSAEDAIKIADEAIDIANRASEGIGFKTLAEMYAYINSMSWLKDYNFDRTAIIPKDSYVVISIDFETKEYVNSEGEIEYLTPRTADYFYSEDCEVVFVNGAEINVKSNRVYCVYKILNDITFNDISFFGFYTYNADQTDRVYFNSNERIVITDKKEPTYQEYGSYKIPYGTHMGIEEEGVPDYWWAGIRAVESEAKIDLKDYAKTEEVKAGLQLILDAVNSLSGGESS